MLVSIEVFFICQKYKNVIKFARYSSWFTLFSITQPDGTYKTVGYSAGVDGYKTLPLEQVSPFGLAPFPHDMDGEEDKELEPISALQNLAKVSNWYNSHLFGRNSIPK